MSCLTVMEDILLHFDTKTELSHDTRAFSTQAGDAISFVAANKRKLQFLIGILKPIAIEIKKFEGEHYPTFHLVAMYWAKLHKTADELKGSNDVFEKAIGSALKESLDRKNKYITHYHFAATVLFPPTRRLMAFSADEKLRAEKALKDVSDWYIIQPKNVAKETSRYSDMYDSVTLNEDTFEGELLRYQSSPEVFEENDDLLNWWWQRRATYPRLAVAAKKLLGIPASSTSPERSFSHSHLLITDQRSNLGASTVEGLMLGGFY
uniref:HAT C-terminal dimerisation domain-containing protein n=1 Tax=Panagrolaimus sp. PS1159 TaxID=55785 RepID=A0AC35F284_9BILA